MITRTLHRLVVDPVGTMRRVARHQLAAARAKTQRRRDRCNSTYSMEMPMFEQGLRGFCAEPDLSACRPVHHQLVATTRAVLSHRFDLLGSGWVTVRHGIACRGREGHRYPPGPTVERCSGGGWLPGRVNPANAAESRRIWSHVAPDYVAIDWQLDFISGYRWDEATWYRDVRYAPVPGADIKVPWELARMQHLVPLAQAHAQGGSGGVGFAPPDRYAREFHDQILDFVAANPPRFGIHWQSPMEVGIRVANWLLAWELFQSSGAGFDEEFVAILTRSVYEHALHIVTHLEWFPELRSNHYLANVVGLLWAAAYLPRTRETDAWLAFAVQELGEEVLQQFHPEGSNFEASSCYHRFSAEMAVYGAALVLGLPADKQAALEEYDPRVVSGRKPLRPPPMTFSPWPGRTSPIPLPTEYFERLEGMARFTMAITRPDGRVVQLGDNDSGRLFKVHTPLIRRSVAEVRELYGNLDGSSGVPEDEDYWDEDHLDHHHLVAAIGALTGREDFLRWGESAPTEIALVRALARDLPPVSGPTVAFIRPPAPTPAGLDGHWNELRHSLEILPETHRESLRIPLSEPLDLGTVTLHGFPEFGVYVFRAPDFFLSVRCGPIGQNGNGGHAHNDQLSLTLTVDGEDWITDPGTYLYTALPEVRNRYRSVWAHFAPRLDEGEPADLGQGLFRLRKDSAATCHWFGPWRFAGEHRGYGVPLFRLVWLEPDAVRILDGCPARPLGRYRPIGAPAPVDGRTLCQELSQGSPPFSSGYGIVLRKSAGAAP